MPSTGFHGMPCRGAAMPAANTAFYSRPPLHSTAAPYSALKNGVCGAEGSIIGYRAALPPGEDINSWLLKCERAMSRLARLDVPLLDPSATEVGWLRLDFDLRKGKYCWKGEWESRYKDQHPE